jgi:hypothetical protein
LMICNADCGAASGIADEKGRPEVLRTAQRQRSLKAVVRVRAESETSAREVQLPVTVAWPRIRAAR